MGKMLHVEGHRCTGVHNILFSQFPCMLLTGSLDAFGILLSFSVFVFSLSSFFVSVPYARLGCF